MSQTGTSMLGQLHSKVDIQGAAAGLVAKVLRSQAWHKSMKETNDRSHSALTCMAHGILSWTYLQSDNQRDSRQHHASMLANPQSRGVQHTESEDSVMPQASSQTKKRQGGLHLPLLPARGRHRGSKSRTLLPLRLFTESRARCAARCAARRTK